MGQERTDQLPSVDFVRPLNSRGGCGRSRPIDQQELVSAAAAAPGSITSDESSVVARRCGEHQLKSSCEGR